MTRDSIFQGPQFSIIYRFADSQNGQKNKPRQTHLAKIIPI